MGRDMGYVLGLDVGASSIGWAAIDPKQLKLWGTGVRVFPEGVDNYDTKKEKPKMESRRIARGMRRQIMRRAERKRAMRRLLAEVGLSPNEPATPEEKNGDYPYHLRRKGLTEALTPAEFGRVLIHLNQRRGFKSNRKTDRGRKADDKGTLGEINWVQQQIEASQSKTLGEMLAKVLVGEWKPESGDIDKLRTRVRTIHTRREMFLHEFELLWERQKAFDSPLSKLLTDQLKKRLNNPIKDDDWMHKGLMFGQRNMYWPADVVGRCELEPRLKRCERGDRLAQRFRLLQEVNNLRYYDPELGEERPLNEEQRTLLLAKLSEADKMDFEKIRRCLGFIDSIAFNLERGKRKSIKGMPTDAALANRALFGKRWHEFTEEEKNKIVRQLIDLDDDDLMQKAVQEWKLSPEAAEKLLSIELPDGYASLSRVALQKLLPHMERGLLYMSDDNTPCALTEAGYLRPDQRPRKLYDLLPDPPEMTNPVVRQALHEIKRVVNAVIREHGKPDRIHIELARDATKSIEERMQSAKFRQENEDRRSDAADIIRKAGVKVSRDGIDRVLLWIEQNETCAYSGKPISLTQLLAGEADIDHILPYSRCLDDSLGNKVVAFRSENQAKGNQTPREWLERDAAKYEKVQQFAKRLPYKKRLRFVQKELELDKFVQRQLNDTRYISSAVTDYLRGLVAEPHFVLCPKGTHTAELRRHWGLNTILKELPDSPAWIEEADMRDGEKDRSDHRHHAIDAVVVALTDQSRLQQLSRIARQGGTNATGEVLPNPWPQFRDDIKEAVSGINVSHRVQRRVSGGLHEDTLYGPVYEKQLDGQITRLSGEFVIRKPLESLTPSMIEEIRDDAIRTIVKKRLDERGVKYGRKTTGGIPKETWSNPPVTMPSGTPIKKVRLIKRDQTIQSIRKDTAWVKPGSTHHLCIFEWTEKGKKKRDAIFVTMLEAINRISRGEPIICHVHPDKPDAKFILSLSAREFLLLHVNGQDRLYRFDTAASTTKQMTFYPHNAAEQVGKLTKYPDSLFALNPRKVTVDPLGRIRWAND